MQVIEAQEDTGVRAMMSRNPIVVAVVLVAAIGAGLWYAFTAMSTPTQQIFATTDDGQTWFKTANTNVPPFTSGGKEAVQVIMLSCDEGKTRIPGYLARYSDKDRTIVEQALRTKAGGSLPMPEIKRRGESTWLKPVSGASDHAAANTPEALQRSKAYQAAKIIKCPDGSNALVYED